MLCGAVTILLSPLFPSVSSYVFLGLGPAEFRNVNVSPGYTQFAHLDALRKGTLTLIELPKLQGIIAFPSYHAGLATVNAWGFWNARSTWLRIGGVLLATGTIVSAPVHGGHYFADVMAGMAIAVLSIEAARRLAYWRGPAIPLRASPFRRSREAFAP
jgi:membrane-associated phospholipid phosphatase